MSPGEDPEGGYSWFLKTQLDAHDAVVLVADLDGLTAGYVYAGLEPLSWKEPRGPAGFIHDIVVIEDARRFGVARQLLNAALAWLREQGTPRRTMIEMTLELDDRDGGDR